MIQTNNKNFWIAQFLGWLLIGAFNLLAQYVVGQSNKVLWLNIMSLIILGFLLTSTYRYFLNRFSWSSWTKTKLTAVILSSSIVLSFTFTMTIHFFFKILLQVEGIEYPRSEMVSTFFVFAVLMLAWNMIYFAIHYQNNWNQAEIDKWKLQTEVKDAQIGALKAQINPHFVFNSINNIHSLIYEDKDKARKYLMHFSDLFRYSLSTTEELMVPLKDELEIVHQYIELLSIQYEERLKFEFYIEENLLDQKIPPMMIQLLIENAIKHGISQFEDGGTITLTIENHVGEMNIQVKNRVSLNNNSNLENKLGVGLVNLENRLDHIYKGKAEFGIKEENQIVLATMQIPMI